MKNLTILYKGSIRVDYFVNGEWKTERIFIAAKFRRYSHFKDENTRLNLDRYTEKVKQTIQNARDELKNVGVTTPIIFGYNGSQVQFFLSQMKRTPTLFINPRIARVKDVDFLTWIMPLVPSLDAETILKIKLQMKLLGIRK